VRIGIDIGKALGPLDGLARYARGLVAGLAATDRENRYLLYPLCEEGTEKRFREVFPALPPGFEFAGRRAPAAGEVELFHCTSSAVPHAAGTALVYTLHDLTFLTLAATHTLHNRLHCLRGLARALARGARLLAVSESTRRDAIGLLGLPGDGIDVVHPAADERFQPAGASAVEALRRRLGLTAPYVLTVGTLEPRKNLPALIAAFGLLPERLRREWLLVAAGARGWRLAEVAELAAAAGVADRVRWLDRVPDDDLPALYSGAGVFAYPSLAEGFGLPPVEAMACGAPVVVSRTTALPEVVGDAGVLVDPLDPGAIRDGLAALLDDPERRRALSAAGRARAGVFSWQRTARETLAVYRRAAGAAG
jgi:glycosyltransferase involved in cell wall biosynthesis